LIVLIVKLASAQSQLLCAVLLVLHWQVVQEIVAARLQQGLDNSAILPAALQALALELDVTAEHLAAAFAACTYAPPAAAAAGAAAHSSAAQQRRPLQLTRSLTGAAVDAAAAAHTEGGHHAGDGYVSGGCTPLAGSTRGWVSEGGMLGTDSSDLCALAVRMRESLGVKDRIYRLKVYRKCFIGSAAVAWLLDEAEAAYDVAHALRIGACYSLVYLQLLRCGSHQ
jgi:hypothetical protein